MACHAVFAATAATAWADGPGPLPAGWPPTLKVGIDSAVTEAAALRAKAPFATRVQFLDYTDPLRNWSTYEPGGEFISTYVRETLAVGMTPVFSYYVMKGMTGAEGPLEAVTLADKGRATEYMGLLKLFMEQAGRFEDTPVVLHVEPDMWAFLQGLTAGGGAGQIPAAVASTGMPELAGLPDTLAGFAQAIVALRDRYAPNVVLGWHLSNWGPGFDLRHVLVDDAAFDGVTVALATYYRSFGAQFDITFVDVEEHDTGHWASLGVSRAWDAATYARQVRMMRTFNRLTGQRLVLWQIPMGNTIMRATDNTSGHWEDNHVQWLLDDPAGPRLAAYLDAGVIALMFGRGAPDDTCACDARGDGVTDPPVRGTHTQASYSPDDDGGLLARRLTEYVAGGELALPVGAIDPLGPAPPVSPATPGATTPPAATATTPSTPAVAASAPARTPAPGALAAAAVFDGAPRASGSSDAAAPPSGASYVWLPATRRCGPASTGLRIRMRRVAGVARASILVDGRRVRLVRGRALRAPIHVRRLPSRRFTLRAVITRSGAPSVQVTRRYAAC